MSLIRDALEAYVECALWSSLDEDGAPLDDNYDYDDLAPETLASMKRDVEEFCSDEENLDLLVDMDPEQIGHDFWLTRNGHGAGFWDRGLGEVGRKLTKAAHAYGECDLYVGDDGKLYL